MAEEDLDEMNVGARLQQMGVEAVAQATDGDRLGEAGFPDRDATGRLQRGGADRQACVTLGSSRLRWLGQDARRSADGQQPWREV